LTGEAGTPALIWSPLPDAETAERIAATLLDEALIACANIMGPMTSLYVWKGERGRDEETGVLFKTNAAVLDRAIARLGELHPYEEPAILGWHCDAAASGTAAWLATMGR
jgi:periplasmic divalent cation tolerance protein